MELCGLHSPEYLGPALTDLPAMAFPGQGQPSHSSACTGNFPIRLLQCTLRESALEDDSEVAARLLAVTSYRDHITPVLKELHWLPICFWSEFKVLVMMFKALNGLGPRYLRERLTLYMLAQDLRSVGGALLCIPPAQHTPNDGTRERAFSVVAPRLWNALPLEAQLAPTLISFKMLRS